jgi:hypothetical protein
MSFVNINEYFKALEALPPAQAEKKILQVEKKIVSIKNKLGISCNVSHMPNKTTIEAIESKSIKSEGLTAKILSNPSGKDVGKMSNDELKLFFGKTSNIKNSSKFTDAYLEDIKHKMRKEYAK